MKGALEGVDGVADIQTDVATNSCTFKAPKDLDVDAALNEIVAGGNAHVKGWSKN